MVKLKSSDSVAVTSRSFSQNEVLVNELRNHFSKVKLNETGETLKGESLRVFLDNADKAIIGIEEINKGLLSQLPKLKMISKYGVGLNNINWLGLVKSKRWPQRSFVNLSPVLLKAVIAAAKNHHVAETVLLTNWLLHDVSLDTANPADLASVIKALDQIGQSETAKAFTQEVVKAHLMQLLAERVPNGTQS